MLSGAASGGLGAALNGGDVFSGAVLGGIMGAGIGLATLGVSTAIGYGLNSTFPNFNGSGVTKWFPNAKTLQGSLASKLPSVGQLIDGVSNSALVSSIAGGAMSGILSTSLIPRPSIKPVYAQSMLEFSGNWSEYNGNRYIDGCLNWVDIYSDGSKINSSTWSAVSGPWKPPLAPGNYSIQYGNMGLNTGLHAYSRDGADFFVDIYPDPTYEIHPDGNVFGTNGCLGIQESGLNCLTLYKMIHRYTYRNCVLPLSVIY